MAAGEVPANIHTESRLVANLMEISSPAVGAVDLCFALFSLSTTLGLTKCGKNHKAPPRVENQHGALSLIKIFTVQFEYAYHELTISVEIFLAFPTHEAVI
jgi:hypothetical protein